MAESDVDLVVTLGAFIGQVAHTRPISVVGVGTDPSLVKHHGLPGTHYEGPTGIVGVLLEAFREGGIPAVSLWAACPHYLAANPNPAAMLALTQATSEITGIPLDTAELEALAAEFTAKVDEAMSDNPEFLQYVERIEAESDGTPGGPIDPGDTGLLISEIEQYLRGRDS
jgi:predicted ATP-grasp superfamily ATP-dependent carboligase